MPGGIGWPETIVALVLIVSLFAVMAIAIVRYPVDQALKVCSALGIVLGVVCGAIPSYFFARTQSQAREQAEHSRVVADAAKARAENDLQVAMAAKARAENDLQVATAKLTETVAPLERLLQASRGKLDAQQIRGLEDMLSSVKSLQAPTDWALAHPDPIIPEPN